MSTAPLPPPSDEDDSKASFIKFPEKPASPFEKKDELPKPPSSWAPIPSASPFDKKDDLPKVSWPPTSPPSLQPTLPPQVAEVPSFVTSVFADDDNEAPWHPTPVFGSQDLSEPLPPKAASLVTPIPRELKPSTPAPAPAAATAPTVKKEPKKESFLGWSVRHAKVLLSKILSPFVWAGKFIWGLDLIPIVLCLLLILIVVGVAILIPKFIDLKIDSQVSRTALSGFSNDQLDRIADRIAIDLNADAGINAKLATLTKQIEELKNKKVETVNLDPVLVEIRNIKEKISEKLNENVKVDFGPVLAEVKKVQDFQEKPVAAPVTPAPATSVTTSSSLSAPTDSISDVKVALKEIQEIKSRLGGNQTFDFMFALNALQAKLDALPKDIFDQSFVGSSMDSPSKGKVAVFNALDEDGSVHLYWEKVEEKKDEKKE